ncbi:helix-turn-helix transcriptional regulator [Methylobacterium sp. SyP6R]|uniref:helix-turn-helix transcriptional regulator n=1 Tax=Methylobacterium sp. SyP6R TaxID=2718876 RepID=UPI001F3AA2D2|nr:YafY family protein [Methylobacterium sp. SyP6R]MCF4124540.1 YafY family transcriptional regulator [Methylobacterium sp. SyP6R]
MSRAERLLDLIQVLRRHRGPVSGRHLAQETGVSLRTLYRDIASLQAQGAAIEGEPGLGYVLRPGFTLPPLMFREEEIEALVLGMRWVATRTDDPLAAAAGDALAKIAAVLPQALRERLDTSTLIVGPAEAVPERIDLAALRGAIRAQHRVAIRYRDAGGAGSERVIWPFALGFFERVRVVVAWCETRDDFRHFRTDRVEALTLTGERYPRPRHALMREWRALQGIAPAA